MGGGSWFVKIHSNDNLKANELKISFKGHLDILTELISKRAYIEAKDEYGATPLSIAIQEGAVQIHSLLIRQFVFWFELFSLLLAQDTIAETLVVEGADVNAADNQGKTVLILAIENGKFH